MDLIKDWLNENVYHTSSCDKTRKHGHEPCICGKSDTITKIEQLQAELKDAQQLIRMKDKELEVIDDVNDQLKAELAEAKKRIVLSEAQNYCKICGNTLDGYVPPEKENKDGKY